MANFDDINTNTLEVKTITCDTLNVKNIKGASIKIEASSLEIDGNTITIKGNVEVTIKSPKKIFIK